MWCLEGTGVEGRRLGPVCGDGLQASAKTPLNPVPKVPGFQGSSVPLHLGAPVPRDE